MMSLNLNPAWQKNDPAQVVFNSDGSVTFKGPIGDVFLPDDYKDFLLESEGLGTKDENAWFISRYRNGSKILELEWLGNLRNIMLGTWGFQESLYHDGYMVPKGYVDIGTAEGDKEYTSVLLSVRKGESDFGKVFTWMESHDPWMEGENTQGLGFVADSFTEFMNNLTDRQNL